MLTHADCSDDEGTSMSTSTENEDVDEDEDEDDNEDEDEDDEASLNVLRQCSLLTWGGHGRTMTQEPSSTLACAM